MQNTGSLRQTKIHLKTPDMNSKQYIEHKIMLHTGEEIDLSNGTFITNSMPRNTAVLPLKQAM